MSQAATDRQGRMTTVTRRPRNLHRRVAGLGQELRHEETVGAAPEYVPEPGPAEGSSAGGSPEARSTLRPGSLSRSPGDAGSNPATSTTAIMFGSWRPHASLLVSGLLVRRPLPSELFDAWREELDRDVVGISRHQDVGVGRLAYAAVGDVQLVQPVPPRGHLAEVLARYG